MWDIIRESTVGEIINLVSGGWLLPYPDQRPDFVVPKKYLVPSPMAQDDYARSRGAISSNTPGECIEDREMTTEHPSSSSDLPTRVTSMAIDEDTKSPQLMSDAPTRLPSSDAIHSETDTTFTPSAARLAKDLEAGDIDPVAEANPQALEKALESAKIEAGDYILVDWYSEDDPENPRNWSSGKRFFVLLEICLLT
jgi:DHA1 family multidrug resistance protein-like MFS transporter